MTCGDGFGQVARWFVPTVLGQTVIQKTDNRQMLAQCHITDSRFVLVDERADQDISTAGAQDAVVLIVAEPLVVAVVGIPYPFLMHMHLPEVRCEEQADITHGGIGMSCDTDTPLDSETAGVRLADSHPKRIEAHIVRHGLQLPAPDQHSDKGFVRKDLFRQAQFACRLFAPLHPTAEDEIESGGHLLGDMQDDMYMVGHNTRGDNTD